METAPVAKKQLIMVAIKLIKNWTNFPYSSSTFISILSMRKIAENVSKESFKYQNLLR